MDNNFFNEEMRCDFWVDEKRKKVWFIELEMLTKFDEVCKKHGLTYWAGYGTLLGGVRHKGFIPWDDDIDVLMFRDDYEKFQAIAPLEFAWPYFFQSSYTDMRIWPFSKIRDSRTTGIEFRDQRGMNQGIFMDIFPLDSVQDGVNHSFADIFAIQRMLWNLITNPLDVLLDMKQSLLEGKASSQDVKYCLEFSKKDIRERFRLFEAFNLAHFGETEDVNYIMEELIPSHYKSMKKEWFRETVYLPFEYMKIPAPIDYDKVLTQCYGNYHQFIQGGSAHENIILNPDLPYDQYFAKYL